MRRVRTTRLHQVGLLARPPAGCRWSDASWAGLVIDPVEQLRELADLRNRGLLSGEEYERQRLKVLDR
jgi:hypothetical protein